MPLYRSLMAEEFQRLASAANAGTASALEAMNAFYVNPDCLSACLTLLPAVVDPIARAHLLIAIKGACPRLWTSFPVEGKKAMRERLFVVSPSALGKEQISLLCETQVAVFWESFPREWPTFWSDLVSLGPEAALPFIDRFSSFTLTVSSRNRVHWTEIRDAMREMRADVQVLALTLQRMSNAEDRNAAFMSLASLISWVGVTDISGLMTMINAGIEAGEVGALSAATAIVRRGMADMNVKAEIVIALDIVRRAQTMFARGEQGDALCAIAKLVAAAGAQKLPDPLVTSLVEVSLQLLQSQNDMACEYVTEVIKTGVVNCPAGACAALNAAYARLVRVFAGDEIHEPLRSGLMGIIRACFRVDPENSLAFVIRICENISMGHEPGHCIALLDILSENKQERIEFIRFFEPIMSSPVPMNEFQAAAFTRFIQLFRTVALAEEGIPPQAVSGFFDQAVKFAAASPDEASLCNGLRTYAKKLTNRIMCTPESLQALICSGNADLVGCAALLVSKLQDGRQEVLQKCLSGLASNPELLLAFARGLQYVPNSPDIQIIRSHIVGIAERLADFSDEAQALFIQACYSSLRNDGMDYVYPLIQHVTGPLAMGSICDAVLAIRNEEAAHAVYQCFIPRISVLVNETKDQTILTNQITEATAAFRAFFKLASELCWPAGAEGSVGVAREIIGNHSNALTVNAALVFANVVVSKAPEIALTQFVALSLSASAVIFDVDCTSWTDVVLTTTKIHTTLLSSAAGDATAAILRDAFIALRVPAAFDVYMSILKTAPRQRGDSCSRFFRELVVQMVNA